MTQVSGDMTSGEMTLGRLDCIPVCKIINHFYMMKLGQSCDA